ncbi:hypothetical protein [Paraburkholderia strydomiana]|uniref:Uncharacterized protein n=1 Tax=Paraburkholderia strydomiana TaxID=1245417 RepID=A0ABW9C9H2_9BURK
MKQLERTPDLWQVLVRLDLFAFARPMFHGKLIGLGPRDLQLWRKYGPQQLVCSPAAYFVMSDTFLVYLLRPTWDSVPREPEKAVDNARSVYGAAEAGHFHAVGATVDQRVG